MEKKSTISKKTLKIILGICIGVTILAVAGLFVYTYLADHNTLGRKISIWGVDVSGLDAKQAEEKIAAEFADRPVSFQENDQEVYSTTLKELGYSLNEEALLSKLTEIQKQREESRKLFPKEENIEPECQIEEDEEQEKQALDLSNFGTEERKASVDAHRYSGWQVSKESCRDKEGIIKRFAVVAGKSDNVCIENPAPVQTTAPETVADARVEIVEYSEKSIAVFGDTKPLRDTLRAS